MTAKEFVEQNQDVLLAPVTQDEFQNLIDGCTIFCIKVNTSNKPPMDRTIKTAGYQMVVATTRNTGEHLVEILTVGLTKGGYAKIDSISANDIAVGRVLLFHSKPLPANDKRKNHHWSF